MTLSEITLPLRSRADPKAFHNMEECVEAGNRPGGFAALRSLLKPCSI
jgi:hypothetical protein